MGRRRARFNENARTASRPSTALPHPKPRGGKSTKSIPTMNVQSEIQPSVIMPNPDDDLITYSGYFKLSMIIQMPYRLKWYSSATQNQSMIIPGQPDPSPVAQVQASLESEPMSSKKRKRLEKFIEKQLKKEERVKLLEKLRYFN
jgi:ATP-dependent RNA helicase DHX37/DHR1